MPGGGSAPLRLFHPPPPPIHHCYWYFGNTLFFARGWGERRGILLKWLSMGLCRGGVCGRGILFGSPLLLFLGGGGMGLCRGGVCGRGIFLGSPLFFWGGGGVRPHTPMPRWVLNFFFLFFFKTRTLPIKQSSSRSRATNGTEGRMRRVSLMTHVRYVNFCRSSGVMGRSLSPICKYLEWMFIDY